MNRIETKIIIMITNRLASAKDSDAKTEMIEELSENLYQRYLELTEQGMPEEEALAKAMESLGDVEELLAFLKETEGQETHNLQKTGEIKAETVQTENERTENERTENEQTENERTEKAQNDYSQTDWSAEFKKDLESGIDAFVNIAQVTAKAAQVTAKATVDCARDVAKEVSEQWKERYPDGVFFQSEESKGQRVDCTAVAVTDAIHSLDLRLMNGDITIKVTDKDSTYIEVDGDTNDVETVLTDDGVLSVVQENTASASFFFLRGMRHCHIIVRLPGKVWNRVNVSTVNGDIDIGRELECKELNVSTASGDLTMTRVLSDSIQLRSGSGDICGDGLEGNLHAVTKSGDINIQGCTRNCELRSISGDVEFRGEGYEVKCSSTSGDVEMDMNVLPEKMDVSSISGDCELRLPGGEMQISYRTVSGEFETNLPITGNMTKRRGEMIFGDGAGANIQVSSTSGDIEIYAK